ncbi:MAG: hypothetical protein JO236_09475 [Mycobacterium sp.]|uniref:Rv1535 family protein n=1 Tax=Mycobacterium sp. TaxID=1785 RepID=UPI001EC41BC7|nr:Rv1535 family protein [Mycobacterium sp.]MBW0017758.1 hypothetical protein [Mycobacterium sp.]
MSVALYDEVVTVGPARTLRVVRDETPAPRKVVDSRPIVVSDPLVDGAARLLSVPVRHVYAALWRVGLLEVRA